MFFTFQYDETFAINHKILSSHFFFYVKIILSLYFTICQNMNFYFTKIQNLNFYLTEIQNLNFLRRKKCPYSELFWFVFTHF